MAKFVALKIHYDHRKSLPSYLKYSKVPTRDEYQEYLDLYNDEGVGGDGFHECLNFSIFEDQPAKIYLPPTCIPNNKDSDEEFVFFSFTYKNDKELPSCIVGVHAAARLKAISRQSIERHDIEPLSGSDRFHYHAESPSELTTLITPPIQYGLKDGIYTPRFERWGYGLRYLDEQNALNILDAALSGAQARFPFALGSEAIVLERQISVLETIRERYFGTRETSDFKRMSPKLFGGSVSPPDRELGYLGEKIVYEEELAYAAKHGFSEREVEWISQSVPQSPYDIKSIRVTKDGSQVHFIEVKSTLTTSESNIYISAGQIRFFEENESNAEFKIVSFAARDTVSSVRGISLSQLLKEFEPVPIKYKLRRRAGD